MEYFYISQDKRYKNPPSIVNFYDRFYPNLFCVEQEHRIPDKNVVYIGIDGLIGCILRQSSTKVEKFN